MSVSVLLLLGLFACGDDTEGDDEVETETDVPVDVCMDGCAATMAAACTNGPADQATCESDCVGLTEGSCGPEYQAVLDCSVGEAVTCDASGLPTVEACATEFQAFVACLNG